jgi:hypothetical protein
MRAQIFPSSVQRTEAISSVALVLDNEDLHTTHEAQFTLVIDPIICPVLLEYILTLRCNIIILVWRRGIAWKNLIPRTEYNI